MEYTKTKIGILLLVAYFLITLVNLIPYIVYLIYGTFPLAMVFTSFFSLFFFVLGFALMFTEQTSFRKTHGNNLNKSFYFFVAFLIISFLGNVLRHMSGFLMMISFSFLILDIIDDKLKPLMYTSISLSFISGFMNIYLINAWDQLSELNNSFVAFALVLSASISCMMIMAFYSAYSRIKNNPAEFRNEFKYESSHESDRLASMIEAKMNPEGKCPHCGGELEPGWNICRHCKKIIRKR